MIANAQALPDCRFIIAREVGSSGTPHLQMFFWRVRPWRAPTAITRNSVNSVVSSDGPPRVLKKCVHWERARGTVAQNVAYCAKDGDYVTNVKIVYKHRRLSVRTLRRCFMDALIMFNIGGHWDNRIEVLLNSMLDEFQDKYDGNTPFKLFPGYHIRDINFVDVDELETYQRILTLRDVDPDTLWDVPHRMYTLLVDVCSVTLQRREFTVVIEE